jgi:hypothetical protein
MPVARDEERPLPDARRPISRSTEGSRRRRNHEPLKSGIPKRKKTATHNRVSCKIEYLLRSNHGDGSIASEFFTGDSFISVVFVFDDARLEHYRLPIAIQNVAPISPTRTHQSSDLTPAQTTHQSADDGGQHGPNEKPLG